MAGVAPGAQKADEARQPPTTQPVLHIAADPNNLPFSNEKREGFENKIAELIASDMGAKIEYTWWAQRRGFFREAVKHGESQIVMGVPAGFERTLTTVPYYRSSYVFVYARKKGLALHSFDDPALRKMRIGIPLTGGDSATPPGQALAKRGIVDKITGFTTYGDYRLPNPNAQIVAAVAKGQIDVAIVWGPLGGFFASRQPVPLEVSTVNQPAEPGGVPFAFDICVGVKHGNKALCDRISEVLIRRRSDIDRILDQYKVPRLAMPAPTKAQREQSHESQ